MRPRITWRCSRCTCSRSRWRILRPAARWPMVRSSSMRRGVRAIRRSGCQSRWCWRAAAFPLRGVLTPTAWPPGSRAEALFVALFGDVASSFWLDTSRVMAGLSRFSFMGDADCGEILRYRTDERGVEVVRDGTAVTRERADHGFFRYLRDRLRRYQVI